MKLYENGAYLLNGKEVIIDGPVSYTHLVNTDFIEVEDGISRINVKLRSNEESEIKDDKSNGTETTEQE